MSGQRGEVVCTITSAKVCSVSVCLPGTFGLHVYWEFVTDKFSINSFNLPWLFISVVSKLVSSKKIFQTTPCSQWWRFCNLKIFPWQLGTHLVVDYQLIIGCWLY